MQITEANQFLWFKQVFTYFSRHMDFLKFNDLSQYISPHSQVKFANHINSECPELKKVFAKVPPNTCQSFEYAPIVHFAPMYMCPFGQCWWLKQLVI